MTHKEAIEKLRGSLQQALDSVRTKRASDFPLITVAWIVRSAMSSIIMGNTGRMLTSATAGAMRRGGY